MPVFVAKEFTATLAGQRIEAVACEKCGAGFYYELIRVGVGKGSAAYYIGQDAASNRASAAAEAHLSKRLDEEAELVACPKCHWVNEDLVERFRRRQYRRAPLLIVILVLAGLVAAPLVAAGLTEALGYSSRVPSQAMLAVLAIGLFSPAWVLILRRSMRRRIDPNSTYPRRPTVPPGTPPALVERRNPENGEMELVPAPARDDDRRSHRFQWAIFRPGQVEFPHLCCMCLSPAATSYQSPLQVNEHSDVRVPLCQACSGRLTRRWWLALVAVSAASLALAGGLAVIIPGIDAFGRWFLFGMVGFLGAVIGGVVIAAAVCRPYRLAVVDGDRGIVRFAASNPAYTALLVEQIRASDGLAAR